MFALLNYTLGLETPFVGNGNIIKIWNTNVFSWNLKEFPTKALFGNRYIGNVLMTKTKNKVAKVGLSLGGVCAMSLARRKEGAPSLLVFGAATNWWRKLNLASAKKWEWLMIIAIQPKAYKIDGLKTFL